MKSVCKSPCVVSPNGAKTAFPTVEGQKISFVYDGNTYEGKVIKVLKASKLLREEGGLGNSWWSPPP